MASWGNDMTERLVVANDIHHGSYRNYMKQQPRIE